MTLSREVIILDEPSLEFGHGQQLHAPKNGLALFGPFDRDHPSRPGNMVYGVIGTEEGIAAFHRFSARLAGPVVDDPEAYHHRIWRPYPGFDAAYGANWPAHAAWTYVLDADTLAAAATHGDEHQRAYQAVSLYLEALEAAAKRDEEFGLFFCIVPEEVRRYCRPNSTVPKKLRSSPGIRGRERRAREAGQAHLFGKYDPEQYRYSVDFRRQLKARAMAYGFPLQLLRDSALRLPEDEETPGRSRNLSPLSDRAWNITTTAYYKAGGKPWRLASARDGVCYVGLAFRRTETDTNKRSACCAAQMFLDTGDGVVFKGEYGPWYSQRDGSFHLSQEAARSLLSGVIETYYELGGQGLQEIFLHSRSTIDEHEFAGYRAAAPAGAKVIGIRVHPERGDSIRLFRDGNYPVQRGTLWKISDRMAFLWGSGFQPVLATYRGPEVPLPLRLDIQHGAADIRQVARDILGLTKLNYNSCRAGDKVPVTVGFSDMVGEILIGNPLIQRAHPQFKFYI